MKKLLFSFLFVTLCAFCANKAYAQQYFVYDGEKFSVMITCNSDNTKVTGVSFSYNGKWVEFKVLGVTSYESTQEGGFVYEVLDGKKQKYFVDYYRDSDHIIVTNESGNGKWELKKRKE